MKLLSRLQTALGVAGAVGLVVLIVAPEAIPVPEALAASNLPTPDLVSKIVAVVLGLATLAIALASQFGGQSSTGGVTPLVGDPPESIHGRSTGYPRPEIDTYFAQLAAGDTDPEAVETLSAELRETAVRLSAAKTGRSRDEAAAAIDRGEWTDDERAAVFVGQDAGPLPLRTRLWDYVRSEDADHRRARRAVEALDALSTAETSAAPTEGDDR